VAGFAKGHLSFPAMALKAGLRAEYSSQMKESRLAPRISLATGFTEEGSQYAYGVFYQNRKISTSYEAGPAFYTGFALYPQLSEKGGQPAIPVEAYYKLYKDLVTTSPQSATVEAVMPGRRTFWRDKRPLRISTIGSPILTWIPNGNTSISPTR